MPRKRDAKDEPWIDNYPPLKEWLDRHDARCMWQVGYGSRDSRAAYVECWSFANGRTAIVVVRANRGGWEIYADSGLAQVDETLAQAESRLDLRSKIRRSPRIAHSAAIGLCRQALNLDRIPTVEEMIEWSAMISGTICFPKGLTQEQAQYILENPYELFQTEEN